MNAFLWDRDLRRHYWTGATFDPLASLSDFKMLKQGGVKVLWSALHVPEPAYFWRLETEVDLSRGLTETGRAVVERMVELRAIPDVTHCTPKARREIYALVADRSPVIASHIGVRSMKDVPYNLGEEDVRAIAASGGVVGVIFMPYWLDRANPGPGLETIWRTMEQIRQWSGGSWDHVAIGTDFDGFTDPPDDCDSEAQLPRVRELLEGKGLAHSEVEAILGGNARRVLRNGWR